MKILTLIFFFIIPVCLFAQSQENNLVIPDINRAVLPPQYCDGPKASINQYQANFKKMTEDFFSIVMENNPEKIQALYAKILKTIQLIKKANPEKSCESISDNWERALKGQWTQAINLIVDDEPDNTSTCRLMLRGKLIHPETSIKIFYLKNTFVFTFPGVNCAPKKMEIKRTLQLNDAGILIYDENWKTAAYPGQWFVLKKQKTPSFAINGKDQIDFSLGNDVHFLFDPKEKRIISSNLLDASLFNPEVCKSVIDGKYAKVEKPKILKNDAVLGELLDFGGVAQEKQINVLKGRQSRE